MNEKIFNTMLKNIHDHEIGTEDGVTSIRITLVNGAKVLTDTASITYIPNSEYITCATPNETTHLIPLCNIVMLSI